MKRLNEKSMSYMERSIPKRAEKAVKQAYFRSLSAGCKVVKAVDGRLVESSPDGSVRFIKTLPKAIPVPPDRRVVLRNK